MVKTYVLKELTVYFFFITRCAPIAGGRLKRKKIEYRHSRRDMQALLVVCKNAMELKEHFPVLALAASLEFALSSFCTKSLLGHSYFARPYHHLC